MSLGNIAIGDTRPEERSLKLFDAKVYISLATPAARTGGASSTQPRVTEARPHSTPIVQQDLDSPSHWHNNGT